MVWSYAGSHSAKMVNYLTFRYFTYMKRIRDPMSGPKALSEQHCAVTAGVDRPRPKPATVFNSNRPSETHDGILCLTPRHDSSITYLFHRVKRDETYACYDALGASLDTRFRLIRNMTCGTVAFYDTQEAGADSR